MAVDLSFYAHAIPVKFPQEDFCSSKYVLLHPAAWKTKANPKLTMGFTKIFHDCNWKGAQYIRWRHKAVKNGIDYGHEVGSSASKVDVDRLLAVAEVVCIVPSLILSVGFGVQSTIHKFQNENLRNLSQTLLQVKSATSTVPVNKYANMYITWQILPLLGALIIGAIIRTRQWHAITRGVKQSGKVGSPDFSLVQRVKKLEEDVGNSVTIVRVLSRQLEKLGVRFRVTRQTLRDPINETAALAQKTSEAVRALAMQEDVLEKELREIQHILFAMQEQQQKQLELLLTVGTVGRLQQQTEHSSVHSEENPDGGQGYSETKGSKLKGLKANIDRKDIVQENGTSDVHHDYDNSIKDAQHLPSASLPQLSRKNNTSKSPEVYGSYSDQVNNSESQILSFTGQVEMNPSHIPEVQATVQDINSKCKGDDLGRNTKEKSPGEGSGL